LEIGVGRDVDDLERTLVRHNEGVFMLWRDARQLPEQLPRVLSAASMRLIAEPAVDDDAHGLEFTPPYQHMVDRLKASVDMLVKRIGLIVSVQNELNAVVIGNQPLNQLTPDTTLLILR
jgi:hypothetical protein